MDVEAVRAAVTLDAAWVAELRREWVTLMELATWGEVKSSRLGAMTRVRKRVLDVGERLRSLASARDWIPHPREQLKNALGSAFNLKESLTDLERAAKDVDGGADLAAFNASRQRLNQVVLGPLADLENRWAQLLDSQYQNVDEE